MPVPGNANFPSGMKFRQLEVLCTNNKADKPKVRQNYIWDRKSGKLQHFAEKKWHVTNKAKRQQT